MDTLLFGHRGKTRLLTKMLCFLKIGYYLLTPGQTANMPLFMITKHRSSLSELWKSFGGREMLKTPTCFFYLEDDGF